jgi:glutamate-1-semialdehyde 2,1-aminomutase
MTYAKSLANGYPLAAIGGSKDVMGVVEPGRMAQGGTYCSNVPGVAAALATTEILRTTTALRTIEGRGKRLMHGIGAILSEKGLPHTLTGVPAMFSFVLGLEKPPREFRDLEAADMALYARIQQAARQHGVEFDRDGREPWFLCEAHTDADIDQTLTAMADVLKSL